MPSANEFQAQCNLVLIMGSPRSGTTWLAKIFDSHRSVIYLHEPDSVIVERKLPFVPEIEEVPFYTDQAREYMEKLKRVRALKSAGSLPMFMKDYRHASLEYVRRALIMAARVFETPLAKLRVFPHIVIPDLISRNCTGHFCLVIKSVNSLARTYLFSRADPAAKIIHIIRHPCAYVASSLRGAKLNMMSPSAFVNIQSRMSQAHKHKLTKERLSEMSLEEQLSSLWMLQNEKVMEELRGNPNYRVLVYEDLCGDPVKQATALLEFAGLAWDAQSSEFLLKSEKYTGEQERYFQVIRNPLKAAYKWESELTSEQKTKISSTVRDSLPGKLYY
jgi:hypothetical protein